MKIKTSQLTGVALDWAVARAKGIPASDLYHPYKGSNSLFRRNRDEETGKLDGTYTTGPDLLFSHKWEAGGPIIEREGICVISCWSEGVRRTNPVDTWRAHIPFNSDKKLVLGENTNYGATALEAAMRCYCFFKLGEEIEIPEELV